MNSYIKYNPIRLMLIFVIPAITAFLTVFILFFPIALVSDYTIFSLFSTTIGRVFWIILWTSFQFWIFTPNFKKWFINFFSKMWIKLWFFANKERNDKKPRYFPNGQIKKEIDKHGNEKEYYENGDLRYLRYKNGNSKEFFTGSVLYSEFIDGVTINYDCGGLLEEKSWYDKIEGQVSEGYYPSGKLKWEDRRGKRKEYYENGQLVSDWKHVLISYETNGNLKHGTYTEYSNIFGEPFEIDGEIHQNYPIEKFVFKKGFLHGTQKTWHDVDVLESEIQYTNGLQHGHEKHYNENGQIIDLTNYKNGNLFGVSRTWFENGKKESEFFHGDDSFPSRQWYENGQLFSEEINGQKKYWDESGNQIEDPYKNFKSKK